MDNKSGMVNYLNFNYSNSKGKTKAGDTFNSSLNMGPSDPYYTSDLVKDEVVFEGAVTTSTSIILNWSPVRVKTFSINVVAADGTIVDKALADEFGHFEGNTMVGDVTPAGTIAFTTAPTGAAATDVVKVTYKFDNESVRQDGYEEAGFSNHPSAELQIKSVPVEARTRTLRAYWAFDAGYELSKEYGLDLESLLATQITAEIAHEIDSELTHGLYDFANAAPISTWSRTPDIGVSRWEHYNGFQITLEENSASIFEATQKYGANFAVCGTQAAVVFKAQTGFEPASNLDVAGPHLIGTIGNMKVFVDPSYKPTAYVLGYKGTGALEAGAYQKF